MVARRERLASAESAREFTSTAAPSSAGIARCKSGVLSDSSFDELADQRGRQRLVGGEADGAFAGVVIFEGGFVGGDRGGVHEEKGTVLGGRGESDEHSALVAEGGNLVADALLGAGGCG